MAEGFTRARGDARLPPASEVPNGMGDQDEPDRPERTVVFSTRLYALEAIRIAAERFASHAGFRIVEEGDTFRVSLSPLDAEIDDDLVDSFCNHALFETVRGRRVGRPEARS